jgi:hypothetical protein
MRSTRENGSGHAGRTDPGRTFHRGSTRRRSARMRGRSVGLIVGGVLALSVGALAYWYRWSRRQHWLETVLAEDCRHVPPLPQVGTVTLLGIAMCLVAAACSSIALLRSSRSLTAIAGILLTTALLGGLGGTVVLTDTSSKPSDGLDGSGLPCPSG